MFLESVNPATGARIAEYEAMSPDAIDTIADDAHRAHRLWRGTPIDERAPRLIAAAEILRRHSEQYARLMAAEMGKPLGEGLAEVEKCAWVCEYYAEQAAGMLRDEPVETDARRSFVTFEPLGVILAVMPWNFPFWQVFRFAAPALMAGNAGVLKHSSNVSGCALAIEGIFRDAGLPEGLFGTALIGSGSVRRLIEHPRVAAVTLTGSTPAGRAVATAAGAALKKSVLELGGSDPYVILEDADLDHAARCCVDSRLINGGQSCIAAKRFIVSESIRGEFERRVVDLMSSRIVGDPTDPNVNIGPLARTDLRDELHEQVRASLKLGARCVLGGKLPDGPGAFYPATVLIDVRPGMPAHDEELFGPVAAIIPARDDEDAVRIANLTVFGLGAAVFTRDIERGEEIATRQLEAGSCFVNAFVKSDPRLPFGGIKESGYGRELGSYGIKEFVNVKSVYVCA